MTNAPARRAALVMLMTLSVLSAAPVRAGGPVFMNAFGQWHVDGENGIESPVPMAIARSPDGKHVYVARDRSYYITVLSRDAVTGDLTFVADTPSSYAMYPMCDLVDGVTTCHSAFDSARALAFSPDGRHLYACFQTPARIVAYERDPIDGTLTEGDSVPAPGAFLCNLAVSHDGTEVYATSWGDLQIMTRDAVTGSLTEVQRIGSVPGIDRMLSIAPSDDGQNIYIGAPGPDGNIAVLRRDGGPFVVDDVFGLAPLIPDAPSLAAAGMLVSSDGAQVYVGVAISYEQFPPGGGGGALITFDRDAATGRLTVLAIDRDSVAIHHALWGPGTFAASADGTKLLVSGSDAIALYARDATTGLLTFLGRDDPYCVWAGFNGVVMSSDAVDVYATDRNRRVVDFQAEPGRLLHYRTDGFSCPPQPVEGAESAATSSILISNDANDTGDQVKWTWTGTDQTSGADSVAQNGDGFAVCVYADSGSGPELVYESFAPAGCWVVGDDSAVFKATGSAGGAERVNPRVSSAKLKSRGTATGVQQKFRVLSKKLDAQAPDLPLPAAGATRVQLLRTDGRAWDASYSATDVHRNDAFKFKAKRRAPAE